MGVSKKSRSQEATERLGEESPSCMNLFRTLPTLALTSALFHGISSVGMSSIYCPFYAV
jgi:hypothetical protein